MIAKHMASARNWLGKLALGAAALAVSSASFAAATIVIQNGNAPGVGFNDPTPAAPVGGNLGTTLGVQRLNAFQFAANIWGATLSSDVVITVLATFEPLGCTANSATLGSAGAISVFRDFPNATFPGTWHGSALANKLSGDDLGGPAQADIRARFNSNLGTANCLPGSPFYLGLDNNHGPTIDLVTVLLHEFGHGLGFQTFTNGSTGAFLIGFPSVFDFFLFDSNTNKLWANSTDAERAASALSINKLAWNGPRVIAGAPNVLGGTPQLAVSTPVNVAANLQLGPASFGPPLTTPGVTGEVMPVVDSPNGIGLACTPLSAANAAAVSGKIAMVDRGVCGFTVKVKNAQDAGAIGVIVVDNVAGSPPPGLGGADATIFIPSGRITLADGTVLKTALRTRSRTHSGMFATLGINLAIRAGGDAAGRVLMFAPNPFQGGSSVSHFDVSAFPNLLMEPAINADLQQQVSTPQDLTFQALQDTGW